MCVLLAIFNVKINLKDALFFRIIIKCENSLLGRPPLEMLFVTYCWLIISYTEDVKQIFEGTVIQS